VSSNEQPSSPTPVATPTSSTSGTGNATPAFSYDDLFPALPTNNATNAPLGGPAIARVTSSQKTQVSTQQVIILPRYKFTYRFTLL